MKSLVLFASGSGTNVQRIAEYFASHPDVTIRKVYCNKPGATVLERAKNLNINTFVFNRADFYQSDRVLDELVQDHPDLIVLAGFLWLIPTPILDRFRGRIINIHPALLPKYGGKGMYGSHVHEAVISSGDPESGITIHHVNEQYDEGKVIFQARCPVFHDDTPETLAAKIHTLEYRHYPEVIERLLVSRAV
jgi:phosphoribosylglycinamide formyltransferase-1